MKKNIDTRDMEEYIEANAASLVDSNDDKEALIQAAKSDVKMRKERAVRLQKLRRDKLRLSQRELALAVGANIRTLQSWERGRQDYPRSVEILMGLMSDMPTIKKKLLLENRDQNLIEEYESKNNSVKNEFVSASGLTKKTGTKKKPYIKRNRIEPIARGRHGARLRKRPVGSK
jgi:DNA-binding transcriptional regulator YiaG